MRNKLLSGTACAALCLVSFSGAARSATLDDVMAVERERPLARRHDVHRAAEALEREQRRDPAPFHHELLAVTAIGQYLHSAGGKRLRPAMVLLASKLVGNGNSSAIQLGAVVELIHAATLVHDDVLPGNSLVVGLSPFEENGHEAEAI